MEGAAFTSGRESEIMKFGMHVSIAGSIDRAIDNATNLKCTAFQMFTRNPREQSVKGLVSEEVKTFRAKLASSGIDKHAVCVHMPYFPNLSSPHEDVFKKSMDTLAEEMHRCGILGIPYLVIHLGSHMGAGKEFGTQNLVHACNSAIECVKNDVVMLLENSAGTKNSIGSKFEDIRKILDQIESRRRFGVCLDTCHAFAAGYELRTKKYIQGIIDEFDKVVGLKELKIVHLNDCRGDLNSRMDAHEHIGMGHIGEQGFTAILSNEVLKNMPFIMETPIDNRRDDNGNLKKYQELWRNVH